jgi:chloramphenicol O-acetyltransferase type B
MTKYNLKRIVSYKTVPNINPFEITILSRKTYLGRNCNFNGLLVEGGGKLIIGDNFHSGTNIHIITQNHNFDKGTKIPYDSTYIYKDVIIEDNVWVGTGVIILGGVTIGEGAIIQAGSVVVNDVPKYSIVGGHPAKVFSTRNIEHYEKLKKLKQFV